MTESVMAFLLLAEMRQISVGDAMSLLHGIECNPFYECRQQATRNAPAGI